ncbi:hypothetical protein HAZT_HAZT008719 [Hyalella azteca]|uniref:Strawberry notch AAA domain-containing protein n=1 Tax=Hyalella azteca TaxID=294128 RepID=A0A6A0HD91_HYAAZ|nr:hypothetical protein HAZT_HAZT008719 [Hyalella azteca]
MPFHQVPENRVRWDEPKCDPVIVIDVDEPDDKEAADCSKDDEEELQDDYDQSTYVTYVPKEVNFGVPHPSDVVESESLSCVDSPKITYKLSLPETVFSEGKLSNVQIEAVIYACQAHEQRLPSGERMGFLLGDGVGLGKGRTIAGIVRENWIKGEKKALWVSASRDLELDARRDLDDVGALDIAICPVTRVPYSKDVEHYISKGVLFSTYTSLMSKKSGNFSKFTKKVALSGQK